MSRGLLAFGTKISKADFTSVPMAAVDNPRLAATAEPELLPLGEELG